MVEGKCNICGTEGTLTVCCSQLGAFSVAYCRQCMAEGVEPYGGCVALGTIDGLADWAQDIVRKSIAKAGKTLEDFARDVAKLDAEMAADLGPAEKESTDR